MDERAVSLDDFIHHRRSGGDDIHVEFALKPLLHDFHVQQPEKPATETKTERLGYFRLVHQRRIVELELFKRIAQLVVFTALDRIKPGEHLGLDFLEPGQGRGCGLVHQRDRVSNLGVLELLDAGDDETDLTSRKVRA